MCNPMIDPSLANNTIVISGSVNDENTREFVAENKLTYMAKPFNAPFLNFQSNIITGLVFGGVGQLGNDSRIIYFAGSH